MPHLLQGVGIQQGGGGVGPHAPGVGAGVPFANAFVVLGRRQQHHGLPIGEGKHRHLWSCHPFFQHQRGACRAKPTAENLFDGLLGFGDGLGDGDAFAGGEPIGFHHQGLLLLLHHRQGFGTAGGIPVAGGGHGRLHHQALGPLFAGFQLGPIGTGAKNGKAGAPQPIRQAGRQRALGAHHHELNAALLAGRQQAGLVPFGNGQLLDSLQIQGAAIAWCHPNRLHPRAAAQGPGQGVLTATPANHQDACWSWGVG